MFCGSCGTEIKEGARFCPNCGWAVPAGAESPTVFEPVEVKLAELKCASCGTVLKEGAKFCPSCGQTVTIMSAQTEAVVAEPPNVTLPPVCAGCGAPLKEGALFCANCGQPVPAEAARVESATATVSNEDPAPIPEVEIPQYDSKDSSTIGIMAADNEVQQPEIETNNEVSELYQNISEKNNENNSLASDIERITQERNQSNEKLRLLQNTAGKMKGWIIALAIAVAASIGVGIYEYIEVGNVRASLSWQNSNLNSRLTSLQKDYETAKSIWAVTVDSLSIGNSDKNSNWLTPPGGQLYANQMRYLGFEITFSSFISGNITFYIKKIKPDGTVVIDDRETTSGFSYSETINVRQGSGQKFVLIGWGNESSSNYTTGTWKVEIWYNGVCLKSQEVILN